MEGEDGERDPQGCVGSDASRPETVASCAPHAESPRGTFGDCWNLATESVLRGKTAFV